MSEEKNLENIKTMIDSLSVEIKTPFDETVQDILVVILDELEELYAIVRP